MQGKQCLLRLFHGLERLQTYGIFNIERANARASQCGQVSATTETAAYILGQGADISALAAVNQQTCLHAVELQQFQCINGGLARWALQLYALSGIFV